MFDNPQKASLFELTQDSPRHGYGGDRANMSIRPRIPQSLSIAVSRESGARGATIARRVGEQLGWQVYSQDLLEHSVQEEVARQDILQGLSPEAFEWVEYQLKKSPVSSNPNRHPLALDLVRMVLALGAQGEVIIIGRGAGYVLPRESTLHVRLISPIDQRIGYMGQWLRLSQEEATAKVDLTDRRRAEFVQDHFGRSPLDLYQYDLVINTQSMGEELSAGLIVEAARSKLAKLLEDRDEMMNAG